MEDLLATTVSTQERWVSLTEAYLPKVFKRLKKQAKIHNHSLEEYGFEYGFHGTQRTPEFIGMLVPQFHLESCRSSQAHPLSIMHLSFHQPGTA
jgi:hypothetical protein